MRETPQATGPWWALRLALMLVSSLLVAWFASATPKALSPLAPLNRFSAGRALIDIGRLAQVPHPLGSPQDTMVRERLLQRLRVIGFQPQVQHADGVRVWGRQSGQSYSVDNVVARMASSNRQAPALLLMSHYDSVPGSPGAADDMASVASELEIARLLKAATPNRDVMFAFTDGEEKGLLGAQALFADPALNRNIGFVVNMDVRGGGGRAMMFQLSPHSADAARLFARIPRQPESNSLAAYLYEKMPNDTDFTVAMAHGLAGLNYAFIGRPALYHTPAAVPGAVEPGAVQSLGDQVWAVTRQIAFGADLPSSKGVMPTWFDLFGRIVVLYAPAFGWVPVGLSAPLMAYAAWRQRRAAGLSLGGVTDGAARSLAATLAAAVLLEIYGRLFISGYYQGLGQAGRTEAASGFIILVCALLAFKLGPRSKRPMEPWLGAAMLGWLIAVVLQTFAPLTAFLAEWPVLGASLALAVCVSWQGRWTLWASAAVAVFGLGFLMETWHAVILGVGLTMPVVVAALCPFAFAVFSPFLSGWLAWAHRDARGGPQNLS